MNHLLNYREDKAAEMAALFLRKRGGTMSYIKLMKLLYLAERASMLQHGHPITYDRYVSMNRGPVLSRTKDLMYEGSPPGSDSPWSDLVSAPHGNYEVSLQNEAFEVSHLSRSELAIVDAIYEEHGAKSRWALVDETHNLPEWQHPNGSSIPISYHDVLIGAGYEVSDIQAVEKDLSAKSFLDVLLG